MVKTKGARASLSKWILPNFKWNLKLINNFTFTVERKITTFQLEWTQWFTDQGELVGHSTIWGQFSSKSQGRKHLVTVVVLDNLPDSLKGHGVGIHLVRVHVVQWSRLGWISFPDRKRQSQRGNQARGGDRNDIWNTSSVPWFYISDIAQWISNSRNAIAT